MRSTGGRRPPNGEPARLVHGRGERALSGSPSGVGDGPQASRPGLTERALQDQTGNPQEAVNAYSVFSSIRVNLVHVPLCRKSHPPYKGKNDQWLALQRRKP